LRDLRRVRRHGRRAPDAARPRSRHHLTRARAVHDRTPPQIRYRNRTQERSVTSAALARSQPGESLTEPIILEPVEQLLESIPSRSFPETELLIIVRRNYIALYEHLQRWIVGTPGVKVLVERRATDRRSATSPVTDERRRVRTRRIRRGTISPNGSYTVMRFTPK
jgi:hypothetical protein